MNDNKEGSSNVTHFRPAYVDNTEDELDIESVFTVLSDLRLTPTPSRHARVRLQSDESQDSISSKAISWGCSDSGHYSSANVSDCQLPASLSTNNHNAMDKNDKALIVAMQDVRRLRSELERLSKSEKWYKQELRHQKHARLEVLEKLYGNERSYMQENQRLQRECLQLYARCSQMERDLKQQRAKHLVAKETQPRREPELKDVGKNSVDIDDTGRDDFENGQQRALIADQQQLIEVLRKQKRTLLADLKRLNEEKEAVICELEKKLAKLEAENLRTTKLCKELLEERSALEGKLTKLTRDLQRQRQEQRKQEELMHNTQKALEAQRRDLSDKEKDVGEIRYRFKRALQEEVEPDAIHQLSMDYHREIMHKTDEIRALKRAVHTLQHELEAVEPLKTQNEQQQAEIEQLTTALAAKSCELEELQKCDVKKSSEIAALKAEIVEYQSTANHWTEQWDQQRMEDQRSEIFSTQEAVKCMEAELLTANERYASMCALCESTRFALEMREIELGKIQFERGREMEDVKELREKLAHYLQQTEVSGRKIIQLKTELNERKEMKLELEEDARVSTNDQIPIKNPTLVPCSSPKSFTLSEYISEDAVDYNIPDGGRTEINVLREEESDEDFDDNWIDNTASFTTSTGEPKTELLFQYDSDEDSGRMKKKATKIKLQKILDQKEVTKKPNNSLRECAGNREALKTGKYSENNHLGLQDDADFPEFYLKLQQTNDYIKVLEEENVALKGFIKQKLKNEDVEEENGVKEDMIVRQQNTLNTETEISVINSCMKLEKFSNKTTTKEQEEDQHLKVNNFIKEQEYEDEEVFKDCLNESVILTENMHENIKLELCSSENSKESDNFTDLKLKLVNNLEKKTAKFKHCLKEINTETNLEEETNRLHKNQQISIKDGYYPLVGVRLKNLDPVDAKALEEEGEDKDFNALNKKIEEMHAFIETLCEQNQLFVKQLEEVCNNQSAQMKENRSLEIEIQDLNEILENLVREKQELERHLMEMTKLNTSKSEAYEEAASELLATKKEIRILQTKLLTNDAVLYKLEKATQRKDNNELGEAQTFVELEEKNKELVKQLEVLEQQQQSLQQQLDERALQESNEQILRQQNNDLQQKQKELENKMQELKIEKDIKELNRAIFSSEGATIEPGHQEDDASAAYHLQLKQKIHALEEQLQQAQQNGNQQRAERIELLQKLLEQQNQRVAQLNATQADWEELLTDLNAAQAQVSATSVALEKKQAEFDDLNERFAQQNVELQKLHTINLKQDGMLRKDLQEVQKTCLQQSVALEEQSKRIETLELAKRDRKDFDQNAEDHKIRPQMANEEDGKELLLMQQELKKIHEERQDFSERMKAMEEELHELRKAKRQAIIVPTQATIPPQKESTIKQPNASGNGKESSDTVYDHLRILTKVLEYEYKRKIQRYDKHIAALVSNVKSLKRALATEEQKVSTLQAQQKNANAEMQELELTKKYLNETRQRYEQSQNVVKCLQKQLKSLREQYETTKPENSKTYFEAHEVSNLIDDYKKLIQHSAMCSKRPRTNVILDLLERSNRSVPNFNKLETSIAELRRDIQRYIGVSQCARDRKSNYFTTSLMDELKEAAAAQHT